MRTVAVTMVRDEADVIGATLRQMLRQVDAVIVADNGSVDDTRAIVEAIAVEHSDRVTVLDDPEPAYMQSQKVTELARRARLDLGAEWVVPFDADEWWYSPFGRIADVLAGIAPQWLVAPATLYDHVATGQDDPSDSNPTTRLGWRRVTPAPLPKVACRWRIDLTIEQGNHAATYAGRPTVIPDRLLVVRHFPYRSVEQLLRKVRNGAAAYRAAGDRLPATMGLHWRQWGELLEHRGEQAIAELFETWYYRRNPAVPIVLGGEFHPPLLFDPAP